MLTYFQFVKAYVSKHSNITYKDAVKSNKVKCAYAQYMKEQYCGGDKKEPKKKKKEEGGTTVNVYCCPPGGEAGAPVTSTEQPAPGVTVKRRGRPPKGGPKGGPPPPPGPPPGPPGGLPYRGPPGPRQMPPGEPPVIPQPSGVRDLPMRLPRYYDEEEVKKMRDDERRREPVPVPVPAPPVPAPPAPAPVVNIRNIIPEPVRLPPEIREVVREVEVQVPDPAQARQIQVLNDNLADTNVIIQELQGNRRNLEAEVERLRNEVRNDPRLVNALQDREGRLRQMEEQLREMNRERNEAHNEIQRFERDYNELNRDNGRIQRQNLEVQEQYAEVVQHVNRLNENIRRLENDNVANVGNLEILRRDLGEGRDLIEQLRIDLVEANQEARDAQNLVDRMDAELLGRNEGIQDREEEIRQRDDAIQGLQEIERNLQEQVRVLQEAADEAADDVEFVIPQVVGDDEDEDLPEGLIPDAPAQVQGEVPIAPVQEQRDFNFRRERRNPGVEAEEVDDANTAEETERNVQRFYNRYGMPKDMKIMQELCSKKTWEPLLNALLEGFDYFYKFINNSIVQKALFAAFLIWLLRTYGVAGVVSTAFNVGEYTAQQAFDIEPDSTVQWIFNTTREAGNIVSQYPYGPEIALILVVGGVIATGGAAAGAGYFVAYKGSEIGYTAISTIFQSIVEGTPGILTTAFNAAAESLNVLQDLLLVNAPALGPILAGYGLYSSGFLATNTPLPDGTPLPEIEEKQETLTEQLGRSTGSLPKMRQTVINKGAPNFRDVTAEEAAENIPQGVSDTSEGPMKPWGPLEQATTDLEEFIRLTGIDPRKTREERELDKLQGMDERGLGNKPQYPYQGPPNLSGINRQDPIMAGLYNMGQAGYQGMQNLMGIGRGINGSGLGQQQEEVFYLPLIRSAPQAPPKPILQRQTNHHIIRGGMMDDPYDNTMAALDKHFGESAQFKAQIDDHFRNLSGTNFDKKITRKNLTVFLPTYMEELKHSEALMSPNNISHNLETLIEAGIKYDKKTYPRLIANQMIAQQLGVPVTRNRASLKDIVEEWVKIAKMKKRPKVMEDWKRYFEGNDQPELVEYLRKQGY